SFDVAARDHEEAARLEGHHRCRARAAVEHHLAEIVPRLDDVDHYLFAVLVAHERLDASGDHDVERVCRVALVDHHRVLGKGARRSVGSELAHRGFVKADKRATRLRHGSFPAPRQCESLARRVLDFQIYQSALMFPALTTGPYFAISRRIHSPICSELFPRGSTPIAASFSRMSGRPTTRCTSEVSFAAISRGVVAGENTPIHSAIS